MRSHCWRRKIDCFALHWFVFIKYDTACLRFLTELLLRHFCIILYTFYTSWTSSNINICTPLPWLLWVYLFGTLDGIVLNSDKINYIKSSCLYDYFLKSIYLHWMLLSHFTSTTMPYLYVLWRGGFEHKITSKFKFWYHC